MLSSRQFRLHDFIKSGNGRRFTKREIFENVEGYVWHENASDKCPTIREDMRAINESSEVDAIIVFENKCITQQAKKKCSSLSNARKKLLRPLEERLVS